MKKAIFGISIFAALLIGCGTFKESQVNIFTAPNSILVANDTLFRGLMSRGGTIKVTATPLPVTGQLIYTGKIRVKKKTPHTPSGFWGPGSF